MEKTFQWALAEAGIQGHFTPHCLRHSFTCRGRKVRHLWKLRRGGRARFQAP